MDVSFGRNDSIRQPAHEYVENYKLNTETQHS